MEHFKFYEVGGKVRDELMGLTSKDVDYVAVPNDLLLGQYSEAPDMFQVLSGYLKDQGFQVFLETEDCYTIRAKFPKDHQYEGVADFVMARKEVGYEPGTRRPIVKPGTLYDDLERRDFTVNALARDHDGRIIDYFDGLKHIKEKKLHTPLPCDVTFDDDPLRIIRAFRFMVTKDFEPNLDVAWGMINYDYKTKMSVVSQERIREEMLRCFKFDTKKTLNRLYLFPELMDYVFDYTDLWLKPTFEQ